MSGAVVFCTCAGATAAAGSSGHTPCGPRGAKTLAESGVARVYAAQETVYGCSSHSPKTLVLGSANDCFNAEEVRPAAVAGEVAAYGTYACGVDSAGGDLVVQRLDTGKMLHSVGAITGPLGVEAAYEVTSVVAKPDGSAAWIGHGHAIGPPRNATEVHDVTAHGTRLLDSGPGISTGSLRLRGSVLSWRDNGHTRTARLR